MSSPTEIEDLIPSHRRGEGEDDRCSYEEHD